MKILVATLLVVVTMASCEPPRYRTAFSQQQQNAEASPYNPSGWRPSGPSFNLPEGSRNQENYLSSNPQGSYGPPPQQPPSYEPSSGEGDRRNSTESSTEQVTTENPKTENIKTDSKTETVKEAAEKLTQTPQPTKYFLFVPRVQERSQNLIIPEAPLKEEALAPVIPVSQVYEFPIQVPQKAAALINVDASPLQIQRVVPVTSFFKNGFYTPFSSSFVQIYHQ